MKSKKFLAIVLVLVISLTFVLAACNRKVTTEGKGEIELSIDTELPDSEIEVKTSSGNISGTGKKRTIITENRKSVDISVYGDGYETAMVCVKPKDFNKEGKAKVSAKLDKKQTVKMDFSVVTNAEEYTLKLSDDSNKEYDVKKVGSKYSAEDLPQDANYKLMIIPTGEAANNYETRTINIPKEELKCRYVENSYAFVEKGKKAVEVKVPAGYDLKYIVIPPVAPLVFEDFSAFNPHSVFYKSKRTVKLTETTKVFEIAENDLALAFLTKENSNRSEQLIDRVSVDASNYAEKYINLSPFEHVKEVVDEREKLQVDVGIELNGLYVIDASGKLTSVRIEYIYDKTGVSSDERRVVTVPKGATLVNNYSLGTEYNGSSRRYYELSEYKVQDSTTITESCFEKKKYYASTMLKYPDGSPASNLNFKIKGSTAEILTDANGKVGRDFSSDVTEVIINNEDYSFSSSFPERVESDNKYELKDGEIIVQGTIEKMFKIKFKLVQKDGSPLYELQEQNNQNQWVTMTPDANGYYTTEQKYGFSYANEGNYIELKAWTYRYKLTSTQEAKQLKDFYIVDYMLEDDVAGVKKVTKELKFNSIVSVNSSIWFSDMQGYSTTVSFDASKLTWQKPEGVTVSILTQYGDERAIIMGERFSKIVFTYQDGDIVYSCEFEIGNNYSIQLMQQADSIE